MPTRLPLSDQVRRAVTHCGMTRYRLAKLLDCSQALLGEFVHGHRGLSMLMLDRLAALLRIEITMSGPTPATIARAVRAAKRK